MTGWPECIIKGRQRLWCGNICLCIWVVWNRVLLNSMVGRRRSRWYLVGSNCAVVKVVPRGNGVVAEPRWRASYLMGFLYLHKSFHESFMPLATRICSPGRGKLGSNLLPIETLLASLAKLFIVFWGPRNGETFITCMSVAYTAANCGIWRSNPWFQSILRLQILQACN